MEEPAKKQEQTKKESNHLSYEDQIERMRLAFSNGKLPNLLPKLTVIGYTEERLNNLLTKVEALKELDRTQKKEYAEQYNETNKLENKRKEISTLYSKHLGFCRILMKGNVKAATALEFSGERKIAYTAWHRQVSNFYSQLLSTPEFLEKIKSVGVTETDLQAVQTKLTEITAIKDAQKKETSEAQKATENRDKAFDELFPLYSEFIGLAKIQLQDTQDLEALGVIVKR